MRRAPITPYLFLAPMVVGLLVFRVIPIGVSFFASFTHWNVIAPPQWAGLANYREMLGSADFWRVLGNTSLFAAMYVPGVMIIGLALAVLVNRRLRGITFFRGLFFMPYITSLVAVALAWRWVFSTRFGLLNNALIEVFGITNPPAWLSDPIWALPSVAIVYIWQSAGFVMLLFLAGLQSIDRTLHDAARLDGATAWQSFRYVTLPLLSPVVFFVMIISLITSSQTFEVTYALTRGGPNGASTTLAYSVFQNAFVFYRMGYASALAYTLFALVGTLTLLNFTLRRRWVHYG